MNSLNTTLPANEARANFYQILEEVNDKFGQFTITLRGQQKAVIMSSEEYEGWLETLDIMSDPKLVARIKSAQNSQATSTWEEAKKKLGW